MKKNTLIPVAVLTASILLLCSCQERLFLSRPGDAVRFTAGSGIPATKAAYSGSTNSAGTIERIDWQTGDLMRIYCAQASEPVQKFADYKVSSVDSPASGSAVSTAHIETFSDATDGVGLRWGEGDHMFYAAYPSPEAGGITASISANDVTASLSATQAPVSVTGSGLNYTAVPDLENMLMTSKAGPYTAETMPDESTVFLAFTPLTTAVKFTITNQTKAALTIKSVSLTSASSPLNGPFTVDIDDETDQPETINLGNTVVSYGHTYPNCQYTGSATSATKTVTINFATPITLAYDADPANSGSLTFTFFLQPCQNFDDLTFKLVDSDNRWMSTRLGYTDGTGILFPRFKKSTVSGIFVPEGAQWTVKYGPDVVSWNAGDDSDISPMPEVSEGLTVVTSWNCGVEQDLQMQKRLFEFIDLGLPSGTKWANMNIGATAETEYGDHYAWGELSTKTTYTIATYRWPSFSKYNGADNLYTLQAEDDVAHQQLGGRRHIPTREQFEELFNSNYTTYNWVSNYSGSGVNGYLITSKMNSNSIFLPAAGLTNDTDGLALVGSCGCYWTSTLNPTPSASYPYPSCAIDLDFSGSGVPSIYVANDDSRRLLGESIRPVEDAPLPADALLPGLISVSPTKQVQFSRGNLFYNGSTYEFEANQYGHVENGPYNGSHVAHFYWSKDAAAARADVYNDPGFSDSDVFFTNATADTPKSDFTVNGETGKYRILSAPEWQYALFTRIVNGGTGLGKTHSLNITYGGIGGMVIYPDNYTGTVLSGTVSELPEGVVFLPLAGERGTSQGIFNVNNGHGFYWSSSIEPSSFPYRAHLYDFDPNNSFADRTSLISSGNSVRMVADYVKPIPADALPEKFSVSATKQVYFAKGNLQATYNGTGYDWGFATNQYDCVGNAPGNTTIDSQATGSVVDLFGWSTPATNYGINTSAVANTYSGNFKEWGENIGDGNTWYTVSYDEWNYLIYTRTVNGGTGNGHSYTYNITYGGIMGIVLYPDNYSGTALTSGASYNSLPEGVVFLPAAGARSGSTVSAVGIGAAYWSSFAIYANSACGLYLDTTTVSVPYTWDRSNAVSVRLVTNAN